MRFETCVRETITSSLSFRVCEVQKIGNLPSFERLDLGIVDDGFAGGRKTATDTFLQKSVNLTQPQTVPFIAYTDHASGPTMASTVADVSDDVYSSLKASLLNESGNVPLHERYRTLFTLKALKTQRAVEIIAAGESTHYTYRLNNHEFTHIMARIPR